MTDERTRRAVEASDTDELVRVVDGLAAGRDWEEMLRLRRLCEEAVERGKQLWAIPEYVRYRLALEAPPEWAGPAVTEGPTRFTLGPLPEVAASRHRWADLSPHLAPGPERAMVAHECVVGGEDLTGAEIDPLVMELPLRLQGWEPKYQRAVYHPDRLEAPPPPGPSWSFGALAGSGTAVEGARGIEALYSVTEHWVDASNGRVVATCVEGGPTDAVAAMGVHRGAISRVSPASALAWLAWAAASGGAHARRRGGAAGRFAVWWVSHELAGLEWPPEPEELGAAIEDLRWYLWHDGAPEVGWWLRLAVESPGEGLAWAVSAQDAE